MTILSKIFKRKTLSEAIDEMTDAECLANFSQFLGRVRMATDFISDDNGFFTHEVLVVTCGELAVLSPPLRLPWPLEPVIEPTAPPKKELLN